MQAVLNSVATIIIAIILSFASMPANETTDSKAVEAPQKVQMDNESEKKPKPQGGSEEKPDDGNNGRQPEATAPPVANVPVHPVQNEAHNGNDIQSLIAKSAARYGVDLASAKRIAHCESTTGANLVNTEWTAPDGSHPTGVYQFTQETWFDLARQRGWPIVDERLNHQKNIDMFAWAYANGNAWRWECK